MNKLIVTLIITCLLLPAILALSCGGKECDYGECTEGKCVCNENYEGEECATYNKLLSPSEIEENSIPQYSWKYYTIQTSRGDQQMKIEVQETSIGDVDVYISTEKYPSYDNNIAYDYSEREMVQMTVNVAPGGGVYYIGLYAFTSCSYRLKVTLFQGCEKDCSGHGTCNVISQSCTCNHPYTLSDCSLYDMEVVSMQNYVGNIEENQWLYYYFSVFTDVDFAFHLSQSFDPSIQIYMKKGEYPSFTDYDYTNSSSSSIVDLYAKNLESSELYHIGLYSPSANSFSFHFSESHYSPPNCPGNCSNHGRCNTNICFCDPLYIGNNCEQFVGSVQKVHNYQGYIGPAMWNTYLINVPYPTNMIVHLSKEDGNCELYLQQRVVPTRDSYLYSDTSDQKEVEDSCHLKMIYCMCGMWVSTLLLNAIIPLLSAILVNFKL